MSPELRKAPHLFIWVTFVTEVKTEPTFHLTPRSGEMQTLASGSNGRKLQSFGEDVLMCKELLVLKLGVGKHSRDTAEKLLFVLLKSIKNMSQRVQETIFFKCTINGKFIILLSQLRLIFAIYRRIS